MEIKRECAQYLEEYYKELFFGNVNKPCHIQGGLCSFRSDNAHICVCVSCIRKGYGSCSTSCSVNTQIDVFAFLADRDVRSVNIRGDV